MILNMGLNAVLNIWRVYLRKSAAMHALIMEDAEPWKKMLFP